MFHLCIRYLSCWEAVDGQQAGCLQQGSRTPSYQFALHAMPWLPAVRHILHPCPPSAESAIVLSGLLLAVSTVVLCLLLCCVSGAISYYSPAPPCSYAIKKKDEIERVAKANR